MLWLGARRGWEPRADGREGDLADHGRGFPGHRRDFKQERAVVRFTFQNDDFG